ncbi:MAG TPA: P1 family peptidase, partial [Gillisia sp.]|nr:P1 family peptidase [Gillisia sp.]
MKKILIIILTFLFCIHISYSQQRIRDLGVEIGVLSTGKSNAITDVAGVKVGHSTLINGDSIRTGVTAVIPHSGNVFQEKVPAAVYIGNGFGKLSGSTQIDELGNLETPIILTNTLSVATAMNAVIRYTLDMKGNEQVQSVNAVVGETNDGYLNDIRGQSVKIEDVIFAMENARENNTEEGNVGAGTGTVAFGFKGGIGTSSRILPENLGGYTVGVLVQSNFGGILQIAGVPVGKELKKFSFSNELLNNVDGSCMIVVATDAP